MEGEAEVAHGGEGVVVCGRMKIGNTPLIRLNRISDETGCEIYGKVTTSL